MPRSSHSGRWAKEAASASAGIGRAKAKGERAARLRLLPSYTCSASCASVIGLIYKQITTEVGCQPRHQRRRLSRAVTLPADVALTPVAK